MSFPIGSLLNEVPGPPYDSQRDALLYEILQALGGNPDEIMSKPWTPGNEGNNRPPYTSLTDALLYEIWMVINDQPGSGGGGVNQTETIYYGIIKNGNQVNVSAGVSSKVVKISSNYYIVPPAISNVSGNENELVQLWIAEPITEPLKAATLWVRNFNQTFTNQAVQSNSLMVAQIVGDYRIYLSVPIAANMFDGEHFGPVFMSKIRSVNVNWGEIGNETPVELESYFYNNVTEFPLTITYIDSLGQQITVTLPPGGGVCASGFVGSPNGMQQGEQCN
jgi:hypothetical protein